MSESNSQVVCSTCRHNKTISFVSADGEPAAYVPFCIKVKASRSILDDPPHWCPITGTGKPYEYKSQDNKITELEYIKDHLEKRILELENGISSSLPNLGDEELTAQLLISLSREVIQGLGTIARSRELGINELVKEIVSDYAYEWTY